MKAVSLFAANVILYLEDSGGLTKRKPLRTNFLKHHRMKMSLYKINI